MIAKIKKNAILVCLIALFLLSVVGLGAITLVRADETSPVTLKGVKAESVSSSLYAKFVLQDADGNALSISAGTNMEGSISSDTEDSFFSKIVFNLNGDGSFKGTHTFKELYSIHTFWNLHVGYDAIADVGTSTFMVNSNGIYIPVDGDTITLMAGLHVMNNSGGLIYTDYVLSENVTVVYDSGALRVLGDDEAYSLTLDRASATLNAEDTLDLTATVIESVKDTPLTVNWESSNTAVATVVDGRVTAVGSGTATITATVGGKSATCEITVAEGTIVELSATEKSAKVGDSAFSLSATVNDGSDITWSLSKDGIVTLDNTSGGSVSVTPVGSGSVNVIATANGVSESCTVTVGLDQSAIKLEKGTSATVSAGTSSVTWSTSNASVATVENGVITAVDDGTATVTATNSDGESSSVTVTVFTYTEISFTSVTLVGSGQVQFAGNTVSNNFTNFEGQKDNTEFAAFFDNFLIDGFKLSELTNDSAHSNWNVNIHVFTTYIAVYVFNGGSGTEIDLPTGTQFTFKEGCVLPIKENGNWVLSEVRIAEDATYTLLDDDTFTRLAEAGSVVTVSNMGVMDYQQRFDCYEFTVTLSLLAYAGTTNTAATDQYSTEYIKVNGYTVAEINAANGGKGVEIYYSNNSLIVDIYATATMNGQSLIDTEGHTTYFTIAEGYNTPTGYVFEEDYSKYYYGDMQWWSDEYTGIEDNEQRLNIESIGEVSADGNGDIAFIIYFAENSLNPTFHINGVCSWLYTTPYASQIDGQLTSGIKAAVWYGIKIDGKTIYEYMFNSGMTNATNQSTIVAVHFDTAKRLRIVFSGTLNTGFVADAVHTVAFDADLFYTNTGARFANDVLWTYDNTSRTWTDESLITGISLDKTTAALTAGDTLDLVASVTGGEIADLAVTFSSSDEAVATVDGEGKVTAVGAGTVTITATAADGQTATCEITVTASVTPDEPDTPDTPDDGTTDDSEGTTDDSAKSGCGSFVAFGGAGVAIILLAGAVCVLAMKKRNEK